MLARVARPKLSLAVPTYANLTFRNQSHNPKYELLPAQLLNPAATYLCCIQPSFRNQKHPQEEHRNGNEG